LIDFVIKGAIMSEKEENLGSMKKGLTLIPKLIYQTRHHYGFLAISPIFRQQILVP